MNATLTLSTIAAQLVSYFPLCQTFGENESTTWSWGLERNTLVQIDTSYIGGIRCVFGCIIGQYPYFGHYTRSRTWFNVSFHVHCWCYHECHYYPLGMSLGSLIFVLLMLWHLGHIHQYQNVCSPPNDPNNGWIQSHSNSSTTRFDIWYGWSSRILPWQVHHSTSQQESSRR